jgi:hypothetical protein
MAAVAALTVFISSGSFAQSAVKPDSAKKATVVPAKYVTPANASDISVKTNIGSTNNSVPVIKIATARALTRPTAVSTDVINEPKTTENGNDTLKTQKDSKENDNSKQK